MEKKEIIALLTYIQYLNGLYCDANGDIEPADINDEIDELLSFQINYLSETVDD